MIKKRRIHLKGNELEWLIKLGELHLQNDRFQEFLSSQASPKLSEFLNNLLNKFHPNNFNPGGSSETWLLTNDFSGQEIKT